MPYEHSDDELTRRLLASDPLREDAGMTAAELRQMRQVILARIPHRGPSLWQQLIPAVSAAALLAAALGLTLRPGQHFHPGTSAAGEPASLPIPIESLPELAGLQAKRTDESRKIQFETPGGTLVVWVLDPKFPS